MKRVLALLVGVGITLGGGAAAWAGTNGRAGPNREAAKACLAQARQEAPGADKAALRAAVASCLRDAGVAPGRLKGRGERARECLADVRAQHPDADRKTVRGLVKECVKAK